MLVYNIAYELGYSYIEKLKQQSFFNMKNPAVMFDIDDTLINQKGKPIKPIIKLLKKCLKESLIVLIITARDSYYYEDTVRQLKDLGINYSFLYLRDSSHDDLYHFKSKIKETLSQYHDINTIMSIGDNIVDIEGEYSGYFIKLPNDRDSNLYHLNNKGVIETIKTI